MSDNLTPSQREALRLYERARDAVARNEPAEALDLLRACLTQARELTDGSLCGTVLFEMGFILTSLDKPDEAVDAYEECLLFYDRPDAKREAAAALFQLAQVYRLTGRRADALSAYTRLHGLCRELGDERGEGIALSMLGRLTADRDGPAAGLPLMIRGAGLVLKSTPPEAELMIEHVKFFGRSTLGDEAFAALVRTTTTDPELRTRLGV